MSNCFVLKEWMAELPWKQQSVVLSSLRGPDTSRPASVKILNRWLRGITQNNADSSTDYMKNLAHPSVGDLQKDLEYCTMHYYCHLMHAMEIIGYNHPDKEIAETARGYYENMVLFLHLNPETKEQLNKRLEDKISR
ncbi:hypothetical protein J4402_05130 [Candidatus Pacearchaeota archaeon]|nr:hypothetical protein [Candidatus Pacearchaeota archaeon]